MCNRYGIWALQQKYGVSVSFYCKLMFFGKTEGLTPLNFEPIFFKKIETHKILYT
jgi:hypothetical protein